MKTKTYLGLLIIAAAIISLSGCAAKKAAWGSLEKGMIMKYSFQEGQELNYRNTISFTQNMEVMGQEFQVDASGDQLFNMVGLSGEGTENDLRVTVKEMKIDINSPRGVMKADVSKVIDKPFTITVNNTGEELEWSEADALIIEYETGESRTIGSDVQAFFPDLPNRPVMAGDSWENRDVVIEKTASGKLVMEFDNIHTFEKLETYNGYECMKINVVSEGTMEGLGEEQGMTLTTTGTLKGTATWYFAYKEGLFVGQVVEGSGKTTTEITGPQEMTLPATRTYKMTSELVPK